MKQMRLSGLGIVLAIFIGITACAPKATETQPVSVPATEAAATATVGETEAVTPSSEVQIAEPPVSETPAVDVEALILEKLNNNHSISRVYTANKTREEWNTTLDRMIGYGAKISEEEKQIIIDYLLSR